MTMDPYAHTTPGTILNESGQKSKSVCSSTATHPQHDIE
jgi:hypothetical protein